MKKLTSVILISIVFALLLSVGTMAAAKVLYEDKATTTNGISWTIYSDGELVITGKSAISGYDAEEAPWYEYKDSITSVTIKSGVTGIGQYAFYGLNKVTKITIASTVKSLGMYAFASCEKLKSIDLPNNITGLPNGLFAGCVSLVKVDLPSSLKSVRTLVFKDCLSLSEIAFPGSVTQLSAKIFDGCVSLEGVYFLGNAPATVSDDAFADVEDDITIYYTKKATGFTRSPWKGLNRATFDGTYDPGAGGNDGDDGWLDGDDDDDDFLYGDLNDDGKVNSVDRKLLAYVLALREGLDADDYIDCADIDKDGELTPMDDILLSRYLDEWDDYKLPN